MACWAQKPQKGQSLRVPTGQEGWPCGCKKEVCAIQQKEARPGAKSLEFYPSQSLTCRVPLKESLLPTIPASVSPLIQ